MAAWIAAGASPAEAAKWWTADVPVHVGLLAVQRGWTLCEFRALMLLESAAFKARPGIDGDYQAVSGGVGLLRHPGRTRAAVLAHPSITH